MNTLPNDPISPLIQEGYSCYEEGLTKLEYAAIQAMKGILANANGFYTENNERAHSPSRVSELAVTHAKALFDELNKEQ